MAALPTRARFPGVPLEDGHYESFYLKACHPEEPLGVWIRYTVHKRPGARPSGSLWFVLFGPDGPQASKVTLDDVGVGDEHFIRIGESTFGPGRIRGAAPSEPLDASWELDFACQTDPFFHLPRGWMYRAPIPRTKLLSPYPAATFRGWLQAGDRMVELGGWPGMVGHNWGSEHAERWIWMHGAGFEGHEDAWLDVAIGRIRIGRFTAPWIANGRLTLDGRDHRLGGPERIRSTEVRERHDGCDFVLTGKDVAVRGSVGAPRERFVGWIYADPDGPEHHTVNCSISDMRLSVTRSGLPGTELRLSGGAAYELGMRERDHGVPIQPFPDG